MHPDHDDSLKQYDLPLTISSCSMEILQAPQENEGSKFLTYLLAILEQNPGLHWQTVLPNIVIQEEKDPDLELLGDDQDSAGNGSDDELSTFRL